jgi:hypothetical protein
MIVSPVFRTSLAEAGAKVPVHSAAASPAVPAGKVAPVKTQERQYFAKAPAALGSATILLFTIPIAAGQPAIFGVVKPRTPTRLFKEPASPTAVAGVEVGTSTLAPPYIIVPNAGGAVAISIIAHNNSATLYRVFIYASSYYVF